jgi:hypothetical protein
VEWADTLDGALTALLGGPGPAQQPPVPTAGARPSAPENLQTLVEEARAHYEAAQQKLRQGDWAGYGAEMEAVGKALNRLRQGQRPAAPAPSKGKP